MAHAGGQRQRVQRPGSPGPWASPASVETTKTRVSAGRSRGSAEGGHNAMTSDWAPSKMQRLVGKAQSAWYAANSWSRRRPVKPNPSIKARHAAGLFPKSVVSCSSIWCAMPGQGWRRSVRRVSRNAITASGVIPCLQRYFGAAHRRANQESERFLRAIAQVPRKVTASATQKCQKCGGRTIRARALNINLQRRKTNPRPP